MYVNKFFYVIAFMHMKKEFQNLLSYRTQTFIQIHKDVAIISYENPKLFIFINRHRYHIIGVCVRYLNLYLIKSNFIENASGPSFVYIV